jgi:hypothetical protein
LLLSVTVTEETGAAEAGVTVSGAEPTIPSLVALIPAVPAATAVTAPVFDTFATAVLLLAKVIERPVRVLPLASFNVTTACVDCPGARVLELKVTLTNATGAAATTTPTEPDTPSLVAEIVAVPGETADT